MNQSLHPAAWYPDPQDPNQWRYWDGTQWTENRAPRTSSAPTPADTPPSAPRPTGTPHPSSSPGPTHIEQGTAAAFVGWVKQHKVLAGLAGGFIALVLLGALGSSNTVTATGDTDSKTVTKTAADKDGDGVPNKRDAFPSDPTESKDKNHNGQGDNHDADVAREKAAAAKAAKASAARKAAAEERQKEIDNAPFPSEHDLALVFKDPDSHVGEMFKLWGQVRQFDAATGTDAFLADAANRNTMSYGYFDGENALFTGDESDFKDLVEKDLFIATVTVAGSQSYDTQIGGNTTVPAFTVLKITRQ